VGFLALASIISCSGPSKSAAVAPPPVEAEKPPPPKIRFPKPDHVRGIYLTAWSAGLNSRMDSVLKMLETTELNSLVIDIRDAGIIYFKTDIPDAAAAGATQVAVTKPEALMTRLEEAKVYPIARIACFRDKFVPIKFPNRAVQTPDGKPWKDRAGYAWLDPYDKENWEYLAAVVDFALELGFPEIQLDYVRFPSEGKMSSMVFPGKAKYPKPDAKPAEVIAEFANFIGKRVRDKGAVFSADLFGIISSGNADQGIGQELQASSAPFDLICPMVYPSHYARGEYGVANPNASPYLIVSKSLKDFRDKLPDKPLRPWLQDFSLGIPYGAAEVRAQIKAARELGYTEYLLWNAQNKYTAAAVVDTSEFDQPARPASGAAPQPSGG
jgi:hypothetical protein